MNQNLLHHLSLISDLHVVYAEDLSDQLMSKYTSLGLMAVACVLALKQYIFKPIQCWVPAEWTRPWEEYTESYCWIQNTYHVAFMEPGHPDLLAREENEIGYYQWVPLLLPLQALLSLLPHAFWRAASGHISACDPHAVVKLAMEMEASQSPKKRRRLLECTAGRLHKAINAANSLHRTSCSRLGSLCGSCLFIMYVASKVVYLLCGLGHLYLMKSYLGFEQLHFGWTCARDLLAGRQWQQSRAFPRVTFCDVPIKHVGQWNVRSVQCVLPSNMLYEKIYIFLWFWLVFCMSLMAAFGIFWVASLAFPGPRAAFIERLRRISRPPGMAGRQLSLEPELARFLRPDGVFVLQMVALRCGQLSAATVLDGLVRLRSEQGRQRASPEFPHRATLPLRGSGTAVKAPLEDGDVRDSPQLDSSARGSSNDLGLASAGQA